MKKNKNVDPDFDQLIPLLIGTWRRFHKEAGPPDKLQTREFRSVVASIKQINDGLNQGTLFGQDYFSDRQLLGSYILYFWLIHYLQGLSILSELPHTPRKVLDICSGPAPFSFAALRHGCSDVLAIDQNQAALDLGAEISGRYGLPLTARRWRGPHERIPVEGKFDLIILGHCLQELFPPNQSQWRERQDNFVKNLINRLSPHGYLMIVENSYLEQNHRILALRDYLVKEGVPVQAPCVWRGECPALKTKESPCYAQREFSKPTLIKEFQRAAQINLSSLKMTYVIFRHFDAGWPQLPEQKFYRVISPPVDTFQGKKFYLCGTDGKKMIGSTLQEQLPQARAFDYLRRGELISVKDGNEYANQIEITKDTSVTLEAACGKPIPEILEENDDR